MTDTTPHDTLRRHRIDAPQDGESSRGIVGEGGFRASPWLALAVVLVGSYAAALNTTVVGVALPDVAKNLGTPSGGLEVDWVITAFLVGVVLVQPATGWLADRWGRTPVYVASLAVFGLGAAACALAPNMPALVGGRFVQGVGGGALMPVGMTIVFERFPPHRRGTALGVWGVGIAGAPAAGPPFGGWLVTAAGWRWLFAVFVIVAAAAGLLAAMLLRDSGFRERRHLDLGGWALAGVAVVAVVILSRQAQAWGATSALSLAVLTVGISATVVFLRRCRRPDAIVDVTMFRTPAFTVAMLVSGLLAIAQFARLNFLPVELQVLRGLDAQHVGMLLAPAALGIAVAMPLGGWLADRVGTRVPTVLGLGVVTATMWALAHLGPEDTEARIITILIAQGVGTGFAYVPTTVAAMNSLPARYTAQASAVKNLDRQLAGAIGIAILGAVLVADLGAVAPISFEADSAQAAYNNVFMLAFWAALAGTALATLMPGRHQTRAHHHARNVERTLASPTPTPASTPARSGRRSPRATGPGRGGGPCIRRGSHARPPQRNDVPPDVAGTAE